VRTPPGYRETYARLGADGWIAPDLPPELGGQGLPLALQAAAALHFEGAAAPFMMAAGASRAGAHLLAAAAPGLAAEWAPALAAGERTATICISEPDAGSDVGRIRTRATRSRRRLAHRRDEVLDQLRRPRPDGRDRAPPPRPDRRGGGGDARAVAVPRPERERGPCGADRGEARPSRLAHLRPAVRGRGGHADRRPRAGARATLPHDRTHAPPGGRTGRRDRAPRGGARAELCGGAASGRRSAPPTGRHRRAPGCAAPTRGARRRGGDADGAGVRGRGGADGGEGGRRGGGGSRGVPPAARQDLRGRGWLRRGERGGAGAGRGGLHAGVAGGEAPPRRAYPDDL
jgi:hypothetical protein